MCSSDHHTIGENQIELGTFSVSLAVKDIKASRIFYENSALPYWTVTKPKKWLILKSGTTKIGLFQGMFDQNGLTFNPTDVRFIQRDLKAKGLSFTVEADESTEGAAHAALLDPDGNPILFDQH